MIKRTEKILAAKAINLAKEIVPISDSQKHKLAELYVQTYGEQYRPQIEHALANTTFIFVGSNEDVSTYGVKATVSMLSKKLPRGLAFDQIIDIVYDQPKMVKRFFDKIDEIKDLDPYKAQDFIKMLEITRDCPWVIGLPANFCRSSYWQSIVKEVIAKYNGDTDLSLNLINEIFSEFQTSSDFKEEFSMLDQLVRENIRHSDISIMKGRKFKDGLAWYETSMTELCKDETAILQQIASDGLDFLANISSCIKTLIRLDLQHGVAFADALCGAEGEIEELAKARSLEFVSKVFEMYGLDFSASKEKLSKEIPNWEEDYKFVTDNLPELLASYYSPGISIHNICSTLANITIGSLKNTQPEEIKRAEEEIRQLFFTYTLTQQNIESIQASWEQKYQEDVLEQVKLAFKNSPQEYQKRKMTFIKGVLNSQIKGFNNFASVCISGTADNPDTSMLVVLDPALCDDGTLFHEGVHALSTCVAATLPDKTLTITNTGLNFNIFRWNYTCPNEQTVYDEANSQSVDKREPINPENPGAKFINEKFGIPHSVIGWQYIDEIVTEYMAIKAEKLAQKKNLHCLAAPCEDLFCTYSRAFPMLDAFLKRFDETLIDAKLSPCPLNFAKVVGIENYAKLGQTLQDYLLHCSSMERRAIRPIKFTPTIDLAKELTKYTSASSEQHTQAKLALDLQQAATACIAYADAHQKQADQPTDPNAAIFE